MNAHQHQAAEAAASQPLDNKTVCAVLEPLFDIDGLRELNGPCGHRLAQLILPRDANDLTVREIRALLDQVEAFAREYFR